MTGVLATVVLVSVASCSTADEPDAAGAPVTTAAEPAGSPPVLALDFDRSASGDGGRWFVVAGGWPTAPIVESAPGVLRLVAHGDGSAAAFPAGCAATTPCDRAMVSVADDERLDPGERDFEFGAQIHIEPADTAAGTNIVQKGRFGTAGGQWKLQVDGDAGRPGCVVQSSVAGRLVKAAVTSLVPVDDGAWHEVRCRVTADQLAVVVDGEERTVPHDLDAVSNDSELHVGAPGVSAGDDQFHGEIDDVVVCYPRCG
jgi:hypothetical protein